MITVEDVEAAARRLHGVAHRTPVFTSRTLDTRVGASAFVKAENLQRVGAFKFRGAYNKVSSLTDDERQRGVVAFSSGNHAQAVALAAQLLGVRAVILMPEDAPAAKLEATRAYGAEVVLFDRYTADRESLGHSLVAEQGLVLVPPFDDPLVMAGQGTAALELVEDVGPLDLLVVPVSGGGLAAGCATVMAARCPGSAIVGVEPEAGNDTQQSMARGERVVIEVPRTIADGLQMTTPGALTFPVNQRLVREIVTVSDAQLVDAMAFLFDRMKLVSEPAARPASPRCSRARWCPSPVRVSALSCRVATWAPPASPSSSPGGFFCKTRRPRTCRWVWSHVNHRSHPHEHPNTPTKELT